MKKKLLPLIVTALLFGTSIPAQVQAQDRTAEIDAIFGWATQATPGCAVAVSQHGELVVNRAYGLADLERLVPITPETVFDIGSVVKQFVAAAVLLLVEEGQVSLSEDVRTYIPELPDTGHRVTVDHLLTHTGGIRDWTGILPLAATPTDALTIALRQRGLNFAPGEEWSYSNSGYVLLKEIVARASGASFGEFARQRLFEPLGMSLTHYRYDWREVVNNRALAYEQQGGRWKADMLLDDARGGGALLSTASDLLIWNDALTRGQLGAFVTEKIQEPARLNNGRTLGYARGLFLDTNRGGRVVWHSGSANAYNSMLARFPEQGLSVSILCNAGDTAETMAFARRIFNVLVPATDAPSAASAPVPSAPDSGAPGPAPRPDVSPYAPTPAELEEVAGRYESDEIGSVFEVEAGERGLTVRLAHAPATALELRPVAPDRFQLSMVTLRFQRDTIGNVVALDFSNPVVRNVRFTRLSDRAR